MRRTTWARNGSFESLVFEGGEHFGAVLCTPPLPSLWKRCSRKPCLALGHGEVRVYRGMGVSRGVRRTTWERSLKIWELQISCFEEFSGGENVLGLVPASLPHTLGYACTFYAPTSPPCLARLRVIRNSSRVELLPAMR